MSQGELYTIVTNKEAKGKQGSIVAVMAESAFLENIETGEVQKRYRYYKMKVMKIHDKESVNQLIEEEFEEKSIVFSDKSKSYVDILEYVETHISENQTKPPQTRLLSEFILP
jgi:hypothetical protein